MEVDPDPGPVATTTLERVDPREADLDEEDDDDDDDDTDDAPTLLTPESKVVVAAAAPTTTRLPTGESLSVVDGSTGEFTDPLPLTNPKLGLPCSMGSCILGTPNFCKLTRYHIQRCTKPVPSPQPPPLFCSPVRPDDPLFPP